MPASDSPDVLIVAAEASSALYALRLLQHWKAAGTPVNAFGIGSRDMEAEGFQILGRSEEMAVVGIQEVLAHYIEIRRVFFRVVEEVKRRKPKLALLLDYPDFNLRLARTLKRLGIPVVYYVSPQVWAWRQSRVKIIRARVDRMLVLFPFEKAFYEAHAVPVQFVGHPLLDELSADLFDPAAVAARRARYGFHEGDVVLALMPGSRRAELHHHLALQVETARRLKALVPDLKFALLAAPTLETDDIRRQLGNCDLPIALVKDDPFAMISLSDVVLCASGTATLVVGLMQRPMAIMYRMNPLTIFLARWLIRRPAHFGIINLILNDRVVPEFLQQEASPEALCEALLPFVKSADARREMQDRLSDARHRLGDAGATKRVAEALRPYLEA
jgi:lipid-A-disaccharide synthase